MSKIILDFGSGNSCRNDKAYIKRMYDELKAIDKGKYEITCKWQLFEKAGKNIPLLPENFEYAYDYGTKLGYNVTSSVFDKNSLDFLLQFNPCFVKIANNRKLDWLIDEIPRGIPVVASFNTDYKLPKLMKSDIKLCCISKYPASFGDYNGFRITDLKNGISDHTDDFYLFNKFAPKYIEWHYVLEHDPNNLDGGMFARTPEQLAEIL